MARMLVTLDGSTESNASPYLMHNDRLADPLDPFSLEIGKISRKRGKTEADHLELSHLEWLGGMYHDGVKTPDDITPGTVGPFVPPMQVVRSIQNAGKRHKLGASVLRGVIPVGTMATLLYDGPRDPEGMWEAGTFALRKSVGIQSSRTMRTRAVFTDWRCEAEIEVDLTILDPEKVNQLANEAGRYFAVGDYRPQYGRFAGSAVLISENGDGKVKS